MWGGNTSSSDSWARGAWGSSGWRITQVSDAEVAIKILKPEVLGDAEAVLRFDREARAAAVLRGPHIARILDVGKSEAGEPYMVMEYLEGCDLGAEILKRGALTVSDTVTWVLEACEAVSEAHARGIIHRDLKPENLFLTELNGQRVVKLLDFGISRYADPDEVRVTQTHTSFGTPLYMSPEQVRSTKSVDERTDIWALGVILYEALAGEPPFLGDSPTAVAVALTVDAYAPLRKRRHDVPAELEEIVARALQKDPANRYKSVDEMARALAPLREGHGDGPFSIPARISEDVADTRTLRISSVEPLSMGATPRRNGRLLLLGVLAGALVVGVLGAITVRSKLASRVGATPSTTAANGHSASSDAADPPTVDAETSAPAISAPSNGVRAPTVVVGSSGPLDTASPVVPSEAKSALSVPTVPKGVDPSRSTGASSPRPTESAKPPVAKPVTSVPDHNPLIL